MLRRRKNGVDGPRLVVTGMFPGLPTTISRPPTVLPSRRDRIPQHECTPIRRVAPSSSLFFHRRHQSCTSSPPPRPCPRDTPQRRLCLAFVRRASPSNAHSMPLSPINEGNRHRKYQNGRSTDAITGPPRSRLSRPTPVRIGKEHDIPALPQPELLQPSLCRILLPGHPVTAVHLSKPVHHLRPLPRAVVFDQPTRRLGSHDCGSPLTAKQPS